MSEDLICKLCKRSDSLSRAFTEDRGGAPFSSYYCAACKVYQTLGQVANVSPDYVDLNEADLDDAHRFLQTAHKRDAFDQWYSLVGRPKPGASVLDIGCGVGGFLDFAGERGLKVFGFDASRAQAEDARKRHSNVRCAISLSDYVQDIQVGTFDFITMWDVFEHVRQPVEMLRTIKQHLSDSPGTLYVSVPSGAMHPVKVRVARIRGTKTDLIPWEHVFYYTPKSLAAVFAMSGLKAARVGGVCVYPRTPMSAHELVRRLAHSTLRHTGFALQIYALAQKDAR